jgi:hypothetical protein
MNRLGISLNSYENFGQGFGEASQAEVGDLYKALQAGTITGRETDGLLDASGAPLKVESLEGTLKSLTFQERDIRFWQRIPKMEAYNTVEEYLRFISPGSDRGGFVNETELPEEEDSVYQRASVLIKFLGVTKSVSLAMQMVNTGAGIGNIIQRETKNGSLWILRKADRSLAFADSRINENEFDGFIALQKQAFASLDAWHNSTSVIDLRGKRISETVVEDAVLSIHQNFGFASLLMAPPVVTSNIAKNFYQLKLFSPNSAEITNAVVGQKVDKIQTQHGAIDMDSDIFLARNPGRYTTDNATSTKAPGNPVPAVVTPVALSSDTRTKFADSNGDYYYGVAARNKYGESQVISMNAAKVTVGTTNSVDLTFSSGGGAYPATGYVIYRSKVNPAGAATATVLYPIFEVSVADLSTGFDGADAGKIRDNGRFLPGCETAFVVQNDEQVWSFKQLAPLMKLDLALLSQARRFMVLLYGAPALYAPKKMVQFINVGTVAPS